MNTLRLENHLSIKVHPKAKFPLGFFQMLYHLAEEPLKQASYNSEQAFTKAVQVGWDALRQRRKPVQVFDTYPTAMMPQSAWEFSDVRVEIRRDRIVLALERSRIDGQFAVNVDELERELKTLIDATKQLLSQSVESELLFSGSPIDMAITIEGESMTPDARQWADRVLKIVYDKSLNPARRTSPNQVDRHFLDSLLPPPKLKPALCWAGVASADCKAWADAGFRTLKVTTPTETRLYEVRHVFWANQGNPWNELLSNDQPYDARQRRVILDNAFLTMEGEQERKRVHESMKAAEPGLKRGRLREFHVTESGLVAVRSWLANVKRYRLNSANALVKLGLLRQASEAHPLLEHMDHTIQQLEVEDLRFGPEFERVGEAIERSGGVLGWPGFVLATAAITLAALDTWWGIASSYDSERAGTLTVFAEISMLGVDLCLAVSGLVLFYVMCREFARTFREQQRIVPVCWAIFRAAIRGSTVFLLAASIFAFTAAYATYHSSALVVGKTKQSLVQDVFIRTYELLRGRAQPPSPRTTPEPAP